jgi:hypothetical protein
MLAGALGLAALLAVVRRARATPRMSAPFVLVVALMLVACRRGTTESTDAGFVATTTDEKKPLELVGPVQPVAPRAEREKLALALLAGEKPESAFPVVPAPLPRVVPTRGNVQLTGNVYQSSLLDFDRVLAGTRSRMRRCYSTGLDEAPTMSGSVTIEVVIVPNGEVDRATATETKGISPGVAACCTRVLRNVQFDAPGGTGARARVVVTLSPGP